MNIKTMKRDEWDRVVEKKVVIQDISCGGYSGKAALLKMLKVAAPLSVSYSDLQMKITDDNYSWLQIALEDQYFWITAMFDEKDRLLSIYIDMTDGNQVDLADPRFVDMYLDYVVLDDMVLELDRDELEDARNNGEITQAQFERTLSEGEKLFSSLKRDSRALQAFVQRQFQDLNRAT